jgi:hypothetical protein
MAPHSNLATIFKFSTFGQFWAININSIIPSRAYPDQILLRLDIRLLIVETSRQKCIWNIYMETGAEQTKLGSMDSDRDQEYNSC